MDQLADLAIVGSVLFEHESKERDAAIEIIRAAIEKLFPHRVISGGAMGIDKLAVSIAEDQYDIPTLEFKPKNKRWKPEGFEARNMLIAQECTHLLCIRHHNSTTYGSGWTADYAESIGKQVARRTL